jgi:hypothetical protein
LLLYRLMCQNYHYLNQNGMQRTLVNA